MRRVGGCADVTHWQCQCVTSAQSTSVLGSWFGIGTSARSLSTPLPPHSDTPAPTAVIVRKAPAGSEVAASNDVLLAACCAQRAVTMCERGQENGSSERKTARGDGSRRVPNAPRMRPTDPVVARVGHLRNVEWQRCWLTAGRSAKHSRVHATLSRVT